MRFRRRPRTSAPTSATSSLVFWLRSRKLLLSKLLSPAAYAYMLTSLYRLAATCGTIVTMLPSSPEVRQVYLEDSGILQGLTGSERGPVGTLCMDSTTLDVSVARGVAVDIVAAGADMIDSPVSGGSDLPRSQSSGFLRALQASLVQKQGRSRSCVADRRTRSRERLRCFRSWAPV
jgi:hypothetical protein